MALVQQRAPPHPESGRAFTSHLIQLLSNHSGLQPNRCLLVTSIDASFRPHMTSPMAAYYLPCPLSSATPPPTSEVPTFVPVKDDEEVLLEPEEGEDNPVPSSRIPLLPGGGSARPLLLAALEHSFALDALIVYAHQGYTPHLAHHLARVVYDVCGVQAPPPPSSTTSSADTKALEPPSWSRVFGTSVQQELYG